MLLGIWVDGDISGFIVSSQMKPELQWEGEQRYLGRAMAGYAMPGVELKIVDSQDQDLPQDGLLLASSSCAETA